MKALRCTPEMPTSFSSSAISSFESVTVTLRTPSPIGRVLSDAIPV